MKRFLASRTIIAIASLLLISCGGGGGGESKELTEKDLFTRMIGFYETSTKSYTNGELTYSGTSCGYELEMYNVWTYFFSDMDDDANMSGFLNSSLIYTSNSVRYEMSWEDSPEVICTEFEEYIFEDQGATFSFVTERVCDGETWRQEKTGTRIGAIDTPNDVIDNAIPIVFGTTVPVALGEGDLDFFTFTLDESMDVAGSFTNFTGSISGLNLNLYYGERWMPSSGWSSGTVPSPDRSHDWGNLEAKTYYLVVAPHSCGQSGTFDLSVGAAPL